MSGMPGADRVAQATEMFTNMGLGLKAHGMRFTNILGHGSTSHACWTGTRN